MRWPAIHGVIDRRILVNYRVDGEVMASRLPPPFRPHLVRGFAIGGICLIRLKDVRPGGVPRRWGWRSENAAHRIAVEWDDDRGVIRRGVYIPRRDTDSRLSVFIGGRFFPGVHHHAAFDVDETAQRLAVAIHSDDARTRLSVVADVSDTFPRSSIFADLAEASRFFEQGSVGYSTTKRPTRFDGLELDCRRWDVAPLAVGQVRSSVFDDPEQFPAGSVAFDCALLMRDIDHTWRRLPDLCCSAVA